MLYGITTAKVHHKIQMVYHETDYVKLKKFWCGVVNYQT